MRMHGGVKFYRGSAKAARAYVEADHSRADDYYLAEGTGLATRYIATNPAVRSTKAEDALSVLAGDRTGREIERTGSTGERTRCVTPELQGQSGHSRPSTVVRAAEPLDSADYEDWVAGIDIKTGKAKGRLREDPNALRFLEIIVNGPKSWSLLAALHPEIAAAYDAAQERAATEIIGWVAEHATTRVGPRGRQVQVPVEEIEGAVIRHYTSRAGDPHRHLHLQINARVWAMGKWRGIHSVGVRDDIEAINGIGHAAIMCDPAFRQAVADHGYTLTEEGEVRELLDYVPAFSQRSAQIKTNIARYEADWRDEHPGEEPGGTLLRSWDRRAWSEARPDKPAPQSGADLEERWNRELAELGFQPHLPAQWSTAVSPTSGTPIGLLDRNAVVELIISRLGAKQSAWNAADIRGEAEKIIATSGVIADAAIRAELAEDLTARAVAACRPLVDGDLPEHIRSLTSTRVLKVEEAILASLSTRALVDHLPPHGVPGADEAAYACDLDPQQRHAAQLIASAPRHGDPGLVVVEGAAGAGKTTMLAAARWMLFEDERRRMVVLTPTKKAAQVAAREIGSDAFSAAWFIHQHGYRWDTDGHWQRIPDAQPDPQANLRYGDVVLVDEAGMLDQDTALALLNIADEAGAVVALVGDRHQLPAVGRGGVLEHAIRTAARDMTVSLDTIHRFTDPTYADLTLQMRHGENPEEVFDELLARGQVVIHPSEAQEWAALTHIAGSADASHEPPLITARTNERVADLNYAVRAERHGTLIAHVEVLTRKSDPIGIGDRIVTRVNDPGLHVANRDTWTVIGVDHTNRKLQVDGPNGVRSLPFAYVEQCVDLAYVTTIHGAQGMTVPEAHLVVDEGLDAAGAYVGMTRGREKNIAHFHATSVEEAREQWAAVFSHHRADLGPFHASLRIHEELARAEHWERTRTPYYSSTSSHTPSHDHSSQSYGIGR